MSASAPCPPDHPLMIAWTAYKETADYANTKKWATYSEHVEGSLWGAFMAGFIAQSGVISEVTRERDQFRQQLIREQANPASKAAYENAITALKTADERDALRAYAELITAPALELLTLYDWRPELAKAEKDPTVDPKWLKKQLRDYGERKKAGWIALRAALAQDPINALRHGQGPLGSTAAAPCTATAGTPVTIPEERAHSEFETNQQPARVRHWAFKDGEPDCMIVSFTRPLEWREAEAIPRALVDALLRHQSNSNALRTLADACECGPEDDPPKRCRFCDVADLLVGNDSNRDPDRARPECPMGPQPCHNPACAERCNLADPVEGISGGYPRQGVDECHQVSNVPNADTQYGHIIELRRALQAMRDESTHKPGSCGNEDCPELRADQVLSMTALYEADDFVHVACTQPRTEKNEGYGAILPSRNPLRAGCPMHSCRDAGACCFPGNCDTSRPAIGKKS